MQHTGDVVDVQLSPGGAPVRFSWRGRCWQVREVASHWLQPPPWWLGEGDDDAVSEPGRQVWRVRADPGPVVVDLASDLTCSLGPQMPDLRWWLERAAAEDGGGAVSAEPLDGAAGGLAADRSHRGAGATAPGASSSRSSTTSHQEAS